MNATNDIRQTILEDYKTFDEALAASKPAAIAAQEKLRSIRREMSELRKLLEQVPHIAWTQEMQRNDPENHPKSEEMDELYTMKDYASSINNHLSHVTGA